MQTIYCVEDDNGIRELIVYALKSSGFEVRDLSNGTDFERELKKQIPDLVLMDIMLPDKDGTEILKNLRKSESTKYLPVIFLSAKDSELDKVKGLNLGADDYITKPFSVLELISRIKAVLRRANHDEKTEYSCCGITIDEISRSVYIDGSEVQLTYKEFELLNCLMKNRGAVVKREYLLGNIWGYHFEGETRTLDVHIGSLRHKIGEKGTCIETVRNVGYRFIRE